MAEKNLNENLLNQENQLESTKLDKNSTQLLSIWQSIKIKPKCIVFDLDYTLWPFILDSNILPPICRDEKTDVIWDHKRKKIDLYPDVYDIITQLKRLNCLLAIASRSTTRNQAISLLEMFNILKYFDSIQIYSGTKLKHLKNIQSDLKSNGLNYDQILFFDDNKSNLECVGKIGVVGYQVKRHYGLNYSELFKGIHKFNNNQ